jgi:murein DD-endopeptidase MepM/ murein hydrolase activator NlpD
VKNKFYISLLLWIGLAFTVTTSYAKHTSSSAKSVKAPTKKAKASTKNVKVSAKHTKHSTDKYLAKASHKLTKIKLRSIHSVHKTTREPLSISIRNTYLSQNNQGDLFLEPTENNERVHSLINAQNQDNLDEYSTDHNDETSLHINSVHGTINSSLSLAGQKAGLSEDLILQLTNIFAWDIDFATNLHQGDQFTVVYEKSNNPSDSYIVAAEFVNQGRILTALRYTDSEGQINYYSPEGKPMRKSFLSTPVDYVRISSGFDTNRKHPILNRIRAHKGVDYAARTGTPVRSAGDGEVIFCGNKGGYGQVMIVKHGDHYETLYAHLSDFKKGLGSGDRVKQGDVIGYVGQTGLATGPHLHYEFRVDGVHRNPEALNLAQSSPLHAGALANFKTQSRLTLVELNKTKAQSLFAKNQYN